MNDQELLTEYAKSGSHEAFATLAERYTNLIYSAALRQVQDPHAAEDVTQAVLMILMKKAGQLSPRTMLAAWLVQVTRYAALDALKLQARREYHEHQAGSAKLESSAGTAQPSWNQLAPLLDDALLQLRPADRDAVVLRYLLNKSPDEVAQSIGITSQTARKRISRALVRLRAIFARRGITTAEAALTADLIAHAILPAPADLAQRVTTLFAAGPPATIATIAAAAARTMAVAKTKTFALVLSVVLATVVGGTAIATYTLRVTSQAQVPPLTATLSHTIRTPIATVSAAAISSDGRYVLSGGGPLYNAANPQRSDLHLYDTQTDTDIATFPGHAGRIVSLAFRSNYGQVLSAADDGTVRLWDLSTRREIRQFHPGLPLTSMAVSPDGRLLATGARILRAVQYAPIVDNAAPHLRLWDLDSAQELPAFPQVLQGVLRVAFSPNGEYLAAALDPNPSRLVLIHLRNRQFRQITLTSTPLTSLAFSPDSAHLAVGANDGTLIIFDPRSARRVARWTALPEPITAVTFSPDNLRLLVAGGPPTSDPRSKDPGNYSIHVLNAHTGTELSQIPLHTSPIRELSFSEPSSLLLSASAQQVSLWNVAIPAHAAASRPGVSNNANMR